MLAFPIHHSRSILDSQHPASGIRCCTRLALSPVWAFHSPPQDTASLSMPRGGKGRCGEVGNRVDVGWLTHIQTKDDPQVLGGLGQSQLTSLAPPSHPIEHCSIIRNTLYGTVNPRIIPQISNEYHYIQQPSNPQAAMPGTSFLTFLPWCPVINVPLREKHF